MLTGPLRLRWRFKYILLSTLFLSISYLYATYNPDMPLLSSRLPAYSGKYPVGTIDLELPVEKRNISNAILKETGRPAFQLETVLFSLFYPAAKDFKSSKPKHLWISDPSQHGQGYARFAKVSNSVTDSVFSAALWTLAGSTTIPANVDVPLHGTGHLSSHGLPDYSEKAEKLLDNEYELPRFPVIVFSHGMASSRTSYTQWCGELASRGYIVAAVEHRDGSAPGTAVIGADGKKRDVFHISESQLDPEPSTPELKKMQLGMRQAEVEETARILRLINNGFGPDLYHLNTRKEGADLAEWTNRVDVDTMVVAGHSYGATLALQALNGAPSERLPFKGGIVLDPGKESGPLNDDVKIPLLVVNSQSWSSKVSLFYGRPHFDVVKDLVGKALQQNRGKFAWFVTCKGTAHTSATDAPLIEPALLSWATGSTIEPKEGVLQYVKISDEFMRYLGTGHRQGVLAEEVTHPTYNQDVRDDKRRNRMAGKVGKYWQVHVAPGTDCPFPGMCGVDEE